MVRVLRASLLVLLLLCTITALAKAQVPADTIATGIDTPKSIAVHPTTGVLYVTTAENPSVKSVTPGGVVSDYMHISGASGIAFDLAGTMYVGSSDSETNECWVVRIDAYGAVTPNFLYCNSDVMQSIAVSAAGDLWGAWGSGIGYRLASDLDGVGRGWDPIFIGASNLNCLQPSLLSSESTSIFTTQDANWVRFTPGTYDTQFYGFATYPFCGVKGVINDDWTILAFADTGALQLYTSSDLNTPNFPYADGLSNIGDMAVNNEKTLLYITSLSGGRIYSFDLRRCPVLSSILVPGAILNTCGDSTYFDHTQTCSLGPADGYMPVGNTLLTCTNGQFVGEVAFMPRSCAPPEIQIGIELGSCYGTIPSGETCQLTVAPHYMADSNALKLTCAFGAFVEPIPIATPMPCAPLWNVPEGIDIGSCNMETPSGGECQLFVMNGYELSTGSLTLLCTLEEFTPMPIVTPRPCAPPTLGMGIQLGSCGIDTPHQAECELTLAEGYTLSSGTLHMKCSFGEFLTPPPTAEPNPCAPPLLPIGLDVGSCGGQTASGSACELILVSGYDLSSGSTTLVCTLGVFTPLPIVTPQSCAPPTIEDGIQIGACNGNTPSGSSCQLELAFGYTLVAFSLTMECFAGSFTSPTPIATPNPCAQPILTIGIEHGTCIGVTPSGLACTLVLASGYELSSGSLQLTCIAESWSPLPVASPLPCALPALTTGLEAGECVAVTPSDTACNLAITNGYQLLTGTLTLACTAALFTTIPTVEPKPCATYPLTGTGIELGSCNLTSPSGSSCQLALASGYELVSGSLTLTCMMGELTPLPNVAPKSCPPPTALLGPGIELGTCTVTIASGESCTLALSGGYSLASGSLTITCTIGAFLNMPIVVVVSSTSGGATGSYATTGFSSTGGVSGSTGSTSVVPPLLTMLDPVDTSSPDFVPWPVDVTPPAGSIVAPGGVVYDGRLLAGGSTIDVCALVRCRNTGKCKSTTDPVTTTITMTCQCPFGFFGPFCDTALIGCPACTSLWNQSAPVTIVGVGLDRLTSLAVLLNITATSQHFPVSAFTLTTIADSAPIVVQALSILQSQVDSQWLAEVRSGVLLRSKWQSITFESPRVPQPTLIKDEYGKWTVMQVESASASASVSRSLAAVALTGDTYLTDSASAAIVTQWSFVGAAPQTTVFRDELLLRSSSTCIDAGYFPVGSDCLPCPSGCSSCPGFGVCVTAPGYWAATVRDLPVKCTVPNVCLGAQRIAAEVVGGEATLSTSAINDWNLYTAGCQSGYTGVACATCRSDHYLLHDRCHSCSVGVHGDIIQLVLAVLLSVGVLGGLAFAIATLPAVRLVPYITIIILMQQIATIGQQGARDVSTTINTLFAYLAVVNFDIRLFASSCMTPPILLLTQFWLTLGLALCSVVLFFSVLRFHFVLTRRVGGSFTSPTKRNTVVSLVAAAIAGSPTTEEAIRAANATVTVPITSQAQRQFQQRLVHVLWIVPIIFFLKLHQLMFHVVNCVRAPIYHDNPPPGSPGTSQTAMVLEVDLTTKCYEGAHLGAALITWMLFLCYTLVWPIASFIFLSRQFTGAHTSAWLVYLARRFPFLRPAQFRHDPDWPDEDGLDVPPNMQTPNVDIEQCGILFVGIRREIFYSRVLFLYAQFYFAAITVLVLDSSAQLCAFGVCIAMQAIIIAYTRPWQTRISNVKASIISIAILALILILMALQSGWKQKSHFYIILCFAICACAYVVQRRDTRRWCSSLCARRLHASSSIGVGSVPQVDRRTAKKMSLYEFGSSERKMKTKLDVVTEENSNEARSSEENSQRGRTETRWVTQESPKPEHDAGNEEAADAHQTAKPMPLATSTAAELDSDAEDTLILLPPPPVRVRLDAVVVVQEDIGDSDDPPSVAAAGPGEADVDGNDNGNGNGNGSTAYSPSHGSFRTSAVTRGQMTQTNHRPAIAIHIPKQEHHHIIQTPSEYTCMQQQIDETTSATVLPTTAIGTPVAHPHPHLPPSVDPPPDDIIRPLPLPLSPPSLLVTPSRVTLRLGAGGRSPASGTPITSCESPSRTITQSPIANHKAPDEDRASDAQPLPPLPGATPEQSDTIPTTAEPTNATS